MEYWQVINTILGIIGALCVIVVKVMWTRSDQNAKAITRVHDALQAFQVSAAEKYVRYEVLGKLKDEILSHLDRIETKLDRKVDK